MERSIKLSGLLLLAVSLFVANSRGQQPQTQSSQAAEQAQQAQQAQSAEQSTSDPKEVKKSILDALNSSDQTAHRVKVDVEHDQVVLTGNLWSQEAKDQAEKVATDHAGGRKVVNRIRVVRHVPAG